MHAKPCLEKLNQDPDHDVQHFANEALESKFRRLVRFNFESELYCNEINILILIEVIEAL